MPACAVTKDISALGSDASQGMPCALTCGAECRERWN
jgi:hypothetical protein